MLRAMWIVTLRIGLAMTLAILTACSSGSKQRECEPVLQTGCSAGESCGLDADGVPRCAAVGSGIEGDTCTAATDCGAGLGCIRLRGVARCLRFCAPSEETNDCLTNPGTHPYSDKAQCLGAAVDRADIGICVLPCTPAQPFCPEGQGCGVISEAGIALCRPAGSASDEEDCDGLKACEVGLGCVPYGERFVCRPYELDGCPADTIPTSVPGVYDAIAETEIRVCARCIALGRVGADGEMITVCPAVGPADAVCLKEGGAAPRIVDAVHAEQIDAVAPFDGPWWTGARLVDGEWVWPDASTVEVVLTPTGAGDCAVWNAGVHEARDCTTGSAAAVCALASEGVGE